MEIAAQTWFEMRDIRKRFYDKSVWIPLKEERTLILEGKNGFNGYKEEYLGVGSIIVPVSQKLEAEKLGWTEVGTRNSTSGHVEGDEYIPAHVYKDYDNPKLVAEQLILERRGTSLECSEWHLSTDLVVTLNLKREGDTWLALDYGYEEVVKAERNENGCIVSIQIKAQYLKDYLCARKMALYISSYRSRVQIVENAENIKWPNPCTENNKTDRWEGRVTEIHEGGNIFGSKVAVLHVSRTDVDYDEDVPEFSFDTHGNSKSEQWESGFTGDKLYRIHGELWRNEWVNPAQNSYIICDEETEPTSFFITNNSGKIENRKTLVSSESRWLWFKPSIINELLSIRGGSLGWYTQDTGRVGGSPHDTVHFGINKLGLINVYAKDIGQLSDWQQKIWAGHNVAPDGKVSEELLKSQMEATPASSLAPEQYLPEAISDLNIRSNEQYGIDLINQHSESDKILLQTHRFRTITENGLFGLAKDVYRVVGERINAEDIKSIVKPAKEDKWGPLKALEKLIALKVGDSLAYKIMGPLWGIYTLRNADSHLPSKSDLNKAYKMCRIDTTKPPVIQGLQLLHNCVSCLYIIHDAIK